eukprot:466364_1
MTAPADTVIATFYEIQESEPPSPNSQLADEIKVCDQMIEQIHEISDDMDDVMSRLRGVFYDRTVPADPRYNANQPYRLPEPRQVSPPQTPRIEDETLKSSRPESLKDVQSQRSPPVSPNHRQYPYTPSRAPYSRSFTAAYMNDKASRPEGEEVRTRPQRPSQLNIPTSSPPPQTKPITYPESHLEREIFRESEHLFKRTDKKMRTPALNESGRRIRRKNPKSSVTPTFAPAFSPKDRFNSTFPTASSHTGARSPARRLGRRERAHVQSPPSTFARARLEDVLRPVEKKPMRYARRHPDSRYVDAQDAGDNVDGASSHSSSVFMF